VETSETTLRFKGHPVYKQFLNGKNHIMEHEQ
jgi:hypothetical protein